MSPDADRIVVPTNGKGPHPMSEDVASTPAPAGPAPTRAERVGPSDAELSTAFSPRQLAIGFGILASLILLVAGWARRGRSGR